MGKILKHIAIVTTDEFNLARRIKTALEEDWGLEIQQYKDFGDYRLGYMSSGLVIAIITKSNQLNSLITLLNTLNSQDMRKIVVANTLTPSMVQVFRKLGVDESYPTAVGYQKIVTRARELIQEARASIDYQVRELSPLNQEEDFWILENKNNIKKINDHWVFYLIGPSPNVGEWAACSIRGLENAWQWKATLMEHELNHNYRMPWIFVGAKPQFYKNVWLFTGENPRLFIHAGQGNEVYRVRTKENSQVFEICRNSLNAYAKIEAIEKSHIEYKAPVDIVDLSPMIGKGLPAQEFQNYLKSEVSNNFLNRLGQVKTDTEQSVKNTTGTDSILGSFDSSQFQKIESETEKIRLLKDLCSVKDQIIVWTKGQSIVAEANAFMVSDNEYSFHIVQNPAGRILLERLERKEIPELYIRGNVDSGSVFFKVNTPNFHMEDIEIFIPQDMWKIQRRRTSRVKIDGRKKLVAHITFDYDQVTYTTEAPLRDIGVGGVAILLEDDIYQKMSKGKVLKKIVLTINNRQIETPATVRWKSKINKNLSLMGLQNALGLEFLYLDSYDQEFINRFVLEELYNKVNL
jgi:hypothetical protein